MYKKRGRKNKRPLKKEFEYLYYTLDLPAKEIAEKYNVKVNTIYMWASKFRKEEIKC